MPQLTESTPSIIRLTSDQAVALQSLGRRLASTRTWWGAASDGDEDRSVIHLRATSGGSWEIRVADAVGVIAAGGSTWVVAPKVPVAHFLHLFGRSATSPASTPNPPP